MYKKRRTVGDDEVTCNEGQIEERKYPLERVVPECGRDLITQSVQEFGTG